MQQTSFAPLSTSVLVMLAIFHIGQCHARQAFHGASGLRPGVAPGCSCEVQLELLSLSVLQPLIQRVVV